MWKNCINFQEMGIGLMGTEQENICTLEDMAESNIIKSRLRKKNVSMPMEQDDE